MSLLMCIFSLLGAPPPETSDTLDALARDYCTYGLPQPPRNARLALLEPSLHVTVEGEQRRTFHLVIVVQRGTNSRRARYFLGAHPHDLAQGETLQEISPKVEHVAKTEPPDMTPTYSSRFPTLCDLALAVQCKLLGWDDVATAVLKRCGKPQTPGTFWVSQHRHNRRSQLAEMAWNYFCDQFTEGTIPQRRQAVDQLKVILASPNGPSSKFAQLLVEDMEKTLSPRQSPPRDWEAEIDGLLELKIDATRPRDRFRMDKDFHRTVHFQRIRQSGLKAVPTLMKHLDDFRLTRFVHKDKESGDARHIRIANIVADLLDDLAPEPFAYDLLRPQARGKRLDRTHVEYWWKRIGTKQEIDDLLEKSVARATNGGVIVNRRALNILGARYPAQLALLFQRHSRQPHHSADLFEAIAQCPAPIETRVNLLLNSARGGVARNRIWSIQSLIKLGRPEAAPALLPLLESIPMALQSPTGVELIRNLTQTVTMLNDRRAWKALERTAQTIDAQSRLEVLLAVAAGKSKERAAAIRFLQSFLKDQEVRSRMAPMDDGLPIEDHPLVFSSDDIETLRLWSRRSANPAGDNFPRLVVGEYAALQLAEVLGLEAQADPSWESSDWAELGRRVNEALKRLGPTLDSKRER